MEVKISSENGVWDIHAGGEPQLGDFLSSSVTINPPMKVEIVTGASLAQFCGAQGSAEQKALSRTWGDG